MRLEKREKEHWDACCAEYGKYVVENRGTLLTKVPICCNKYFLQCNVQKIPDPKFTDKMCYNLTLEGGGRPPLLRLVSAF